MEPSLKEYPMYSYNNLISQGIITSNSTRVGGNKAAESKSYGGTVIFGDNNGFELSQTKNKRKHIAKKNSKKSAKGS